MNSSNPVIQVIQSININNVSEEERAAVYELAGKLASNEYNTGSTLTNPDQVKNKLRFTYMNNKVETFGLILLNTQNKVIDIVELSHGTIDSASVYPREVIRTLLDNNAKSVIMFHNHPSGSSYESSTDIMITRRIQEACSAIDVNVLDHIIIAKEGINSLAEQGKM